MSRLVAFMSSVWLALLLGAYVTCMSIPAFAQNTLPSFQSARIMVVIPERHLSRTLVDPAGETEIIRLLVKMKYKVIDQTQYAASRYSPEMEAVIDDPTGLQARELTTKCGADVLIVGQAVSEATTGNQSIETCSGRVEIRAVVTQGETLTVAAGDGIAKGADASEFVASKIALRLAGHAALHNIIESLGSFLKGPSTCPECKDITRSDKPNGSILIADFQNKYEIDMSSILAGTISNSIKKKYPDLTILGEQDLKAALDQLGIDKTAFFKSDGAVKVGTYLRAEYVMLGKVESMTIGAGKTMLFGLPDEHSKDMSLTVSVMLIDVASGETLKSYMVNASTCVAFQDVDYRTKRVGPWTQLPLSDVTANLARYVAEYNIESEKRRLYDALASVTSRVCDISEIIDASNILLKVGTSDKIKPGDIFDVYIVSKKVGNFVVRDLFTTAKAKEVQSGGTLISLESPFTKKMKKDQLQVLRKPLKPAPKVESSKTSD